jgi:hypothetical protein
MDERDEKGKFIKGKSGNPKGRTKGSISINDTLRQLLAKPIKETDPELVAKMAETNPKQAEEFGKKKTYEIWAKQIIREALKGNDRIVIELWQQMEGRAKQQVEVDADVRTRGEMILIDASGKVEDDESPLDDNQS